MNVDGEMINGGESVDEVERFYRGADLEVLDQTDSPSEQPISALQRLGAPPFPRSKFPFLGFLASVYDHLAAHAAGRATSPPARTPTDTIDD